MVVNPCTPRQLVSLCPKIMVANSLDNLDATFKAQVINMKRTDLFM